MLFIDKVFWKVLNPNSRAYRIIHIYIYIHIYILWRDCHHVCSVTWMTLGDTHIELQPLRNILSVFARSAAFWVLIVGLICLTWGRAAISLIKHVWQSRLGQLVVVAIPSHIYIKVSAFTMLICVGHCQSSPHFKVLQRNGTPMSQTNSSYVLDCFLLQLYMFNIDSVGRYYPDPLTPLL